MKTVCGLYTVKSRSRMCPQRPDTEHAARGSQISVLERGLHHMFSVALVEAG